MEIRARRGALFSFVWDLLPAALLTSWTQEQLEERAQAGDGGGRIFETRDLSPFDLQTWALETVSGLLAGR